MGQGPNITYRSSTRNLVATTAYKDKDAEPYPYTPYVATRLRVRVKRILSPLTGSGT